MLPSCSTVVIPLFLQLSSSLLEWLYNCAVSRGHSKALFTFVLQFVPDLMYVYLHSIVENTQQVGIHVTIHLTSYYHFHSSQLKVPTEALLLGIVKEVSFGLYSLLTTVLLRTG